MPAGAWAFPRRNRIMAGVDERVLSIESITDAMEDGRGLEILCTEAPAV